MTSPKKPTNLDLYKQLGGIVEQLDSIHRQVQKTNGRVTALERKDDLRTGIEAYEEKKGTKSPVEVAQGWTTREKQLISFITALLALVAAAIGSGKI